MESTSKRALKRWVRIWSRVLKGWCGWWLLLQVKVKFGHKKMLPNHTWACDKGYEGAFCEDAVCDQGCQHGKCLRPGYCTCEDGYKGRACDEAVCGKPCAHGKCTQPDFCLCQEGFFGALCDQQCEHGTYAVVEQKCRCVRACTCAVWSASSHPPAPAQPSASRVRKQRLTV